MMRMDAARAIALKRIKSGAHTCRARAAATSSRSEAFVAKTFASSASLASPTCCTRSFLQLGNGWMLNISGACKRREGVGIREGLGHTWSANCEDHGVDFLIAIQIWLVLWLEGEVRLRRAIAFLAAVS